MLDMSPSRTHAKIHFAVCVVLSKHYGELEWLIDYDLKTNDKEFVRPDIIALEDAEPHTAIEISMTTLKYDQKAKLGIYESLNIPHYIIVDCHNNRIQKFSLVDDEYKPSDCYPELDDKIFD